MIRPSVPGDEAGLKRLWQAAFGDEMRYIDGFFRRLYRPGSAVLWAEDDTVASAIYLLPAGTTLTPDGMERPTAYAYAMGTLPTYRGRGLGSQVARAAIDLSFDRGYTLNIICPAEESLFAFYEAVGYRRGFPVTEGEIMRDRDCNYFVTFSIMSTDFSQYSHLRGDALPAGSTAYPTNYLRYVEDLCRNSGGGLYRLSAGGETGCAAVERRGDRLVIKEILLPQFLLGQGVQALLHHLDAQSAFFRTRRVDTPPPGTRTRPLVLMATPEGAFPPAFDGYFPLVLD